MPSIRTSRPQLAPSCEVAPSTIGKPHVSLETETWLCRCPCRCLFLLVAVCEVYVCRCTPLWAHFECSEPALTINCGRQLYCLQRPYWPELEPAVLWAMYRATQSHVSHQLRQSSDPPEAQSITLLRARAVDSTKAVYSSYNLSTKAAATHNL
jgi:hypothetical protein